MGARTYTPEEERLLRLAPLPDPPFPGVAASHALNLQYEMARKLYRLKKPDLTRDEIAG